MIHTRLSDGTPVSFEWLYIKDSLGWGPTTVCNLRLDDGVYTGEAYTNLKDRFIKDFGRKLSLKRALTNLFLTKEDRTVIWNAYLNRSKVKALQHA